MFPFLPKVLFDYAKKREKEMTEYVPQECDVVQLDPACTANPMFAGCLMVVSEVKPWGVQGYVQALGSDGKPGGQAYYRAQTGTFEYVGKAVWTIE
ncbi:MAG: hypothetical protein V4621_07890 [Pseudomonadota bacterium]